MPPQGAGNVLPALNIQRRGLNGLFHDDVADRLGDNLQHLQDRHAAADERGQRAGEARQANLVGDDAEDGHADAVRVPELPADRGLDEMKPAVNSAAQGQQAQDEVPLHEIADMDQVERRRGQCGIEVGKNLAEDRHDFHQQKDGDQDGHDGDDGRVHDGGLNLFAQPGGILQIDRQPAENLSQQTAPFASRHHASVKPAEHLGMFLQRLGQAVAAFDPRANVADDVAHDLVGGLLRQRLQGLDNGQARINHRCQLPGEDNQVGQRHTPPPCPALLADFLLD